MIFYIKNSTIEKNMFCLTFHFDSAFIAMSISLYYGFFYKLEYINGFFIIMWKLFVFCMRKEHTVKFQ